MQVEHLAIHPAVLQHDRIVAELTDRIVRLGFPDRDRVDLAALERVRHLVHAADVALVARQADDLHVVFGQADRAQHRDQVVVRRGNARQHHVPALEIGERGDAGGTSRHEPVETLGHRHDDAQVGIRDRLAQHLRLGIGREIGLAGVDRVMPPSPTISCSG